MKILILTTILIATMTPAFAQKSDEAPQIKVVKGSDPVFPAGADNPIYGDKISLIVEIDKQGKVINAIAYGPLAPCSDLKDKTAEALQRAAIDAAKGTTFEPIVKDGQRIEMAFMMTYKLPVKDPVVREEPKKSDELHALSLPKPEYLAAAREKRIQGEAKVAVMVDEKGKVISVAPHSGHPLLAAGGIRSACDARFSPSGKKRITVITYRFIV